MALTNAEKQARWREKHIAKRSIPNPWPPAPTPPLAPDGLANTLNLLPKEHAQRQVHRVSLRHSNGNRGSPLRPKSAWNCPLRGKPQGLSPNVGVSVS